MPKEKLNSGIDNPWGLYTNKYKKKANINHRLQNKLKRIYRGYDNA